MKTSINPWWFAAGILLVWLCSPFLIAVWLKVLPGDYSKFGTFGDMFGAINALFSGLTIAGLVYTIILQRQEIHGAQVSATAQTTLAQKQIDIMIEQNRISSSQYWTPQYNLELKELIEGFNKKDPYPNLAKNLDSFLKDSNYKGDVHMNRDISVEDLHRTIV